MSRSLAMTIVSGCIALISVIVIYTGHFTAGWIHFVLTGLGIIGIVWFDQRITPPSRSYWWIVLLLQPLMAASSIGLRPFLSTIPQHTSAFVRPVVDFIVYLSSFIGLTLIIGYVLISNIYPFAIFLDAKFVQNSTYQWQPNPYLYGGVGLLIYGNSILHNFILFYNSPLGIELGISVMTLYYLFHRFRYSSLKI